MFAEAEAGEFPSRISTRLVSNVSEIFNCNHLARQLGVPVEARRPHLDQLVGGKKVDAPSASQGSAN